MRNINRTFSTALLILTTTATLSSCIDEDMNDCGKDYQIEYNLQLHTRLNTTIDTELGQDSELGIANNLKQALSHVFTDHAKDNDLSFYTGETLSHHEANPMDANSASYTIFLPRNAYTNLALANTGSMQNISIKGQAACSTLALSQEKTDTIDSHSIGIFTSRLYIKEDDFDHDLQSTLYMANCASAIVINKNQVQTDELFGFVKGMANGFAVKDSTYNHDYNTVVRAQQAPSTATHEALYAVSFPSKDISGNTQTLQAKAKEGENGIWQFHVIVKINGKYTENILTFPTPLKAGTLKIAKVTLMPDGSLHSNTPSVGVNVKIDWKPGGQHEIEI